MEIPMSAHLLILYPTPPNAEKFDRDYRELHLPYGAPRLKAAGATNVTTRRIVGPQGVAFHMMSDVTFPSIDVLKAAAASVGGQEALANSASISTGGKPVVLAVADD
jgi:hypothetical protein